MALQEKILDVQSDIADAIGESQICRDVFTGTGALRNETYLPKTPGEAEGEANTAWSRRASGTTLKNFFAKAVQFSLGQIFRKDVRIENLSDLKNKDFYGVFTNDVDKRGNNLNLFARQVMEQTIKDGVGYVLIDAPAFERIEGQIVIGGKSAPDTLETERLFRLQPYFVHVPITNVLGLESHFDDKLGLVIDSFKFYLQDGLDKDGAEKQNVFEVTPAEYKKTVLVGNKITETKVFPNKNGFVPMSILRLGEIINDYLAKSPLRDLAENNVSHFQKTSHHNSMMTWVQHPVWFGKNIATGDERILIGPDRFVLSGNPDAALDNKGIDSKSVEYSLSDLKHLEDWCESYTLSLLSSGSVKTATQADGIISSQNSQIKNWAILLQDFLEDLFANLQQLRGGDEYIEIFVNKEFTSPFQSDIVSALQVAQSAGRLSKFTFLESLKSMGIFGDDFDINAELKRITAELPDYSKIFKDNEAGGSGNPNGGGSAE